MGRYADLVKSYLKEQKPALLQELKAAGELERFCFQREAAATKQRIQLEESAGLEEWEADEIARADLLDF